MATANDINYFKLVEDTLNEKWRIYGRPLHINKDDLAAGIELVTKIAVEAVNKSASIEDEETESMGFSASYKAYLLYGTHFKATSEEETSNKIICIWYNLNFGLDFTHFGP